MIPIRDTIESRHYPVVTHLLIGINVFVFLIQMAQGPALQQFIYTFGLVPARYTVPQVAAYFSFTEQAVALVSFMFLHGGFLHILGNMWILFVFGDNVEDYLGSFLFLVFYLASGLISGGAHMMLNLQSTTPIIGASGAIAGVMGAYFILYPHSKILTLIPIIFIPWFVELPAFFFLGLWFVLQVMNAFGEAGGGVSGIAWWAHIGGFVFGIVALKFFQTFYGEGRTKSQERRTGVKRKRTDYLQVIRPEAESGSSHLSGVLRITPYEAAAGTRKTVNIPWGFQQRLIRVNVPPDTDDGMILRLKGLGRRASDGQVGDMRLKVQITQPR